MRSWRLRGMSFYILTIGHKFIELPSPMRLLRTFPPLEALPVIGIAVTLVRDLPAELYEELVKHPFEVQH
jgi:cell cycle arrest protein BUB2